MNERSSGPLNAGLGLRLDAEQFHHVLSDVQGDVPASLTVRKGLNRARDGKFPPITDPACSMRHMLLYAAERPLRNPDLAGRGEQIPATEAYRSKSRTQSEIKTHRDFDGLHHVFCEIRSFMF